MRYSFAPIDAHRGDTELSVLAERIGVPYPTVQKWRSRGMEEHNADLIATALGLHPWQLWPEMLAVATIEVSRECVNPECFETFVVTRRDRRHCSTFCRNRMRHFRKQKQVKACPVCTGEFVAVRRTHTFCSEVCKRIDRTRRRAEVEAEYARAYRARKRERAA